MDYGLHKKTKKKYTWYFSGGDTKGYHFAGVAIVIHNKWNNIIADVQPINERIITITLNNAIPITIIGAYAPTAPATADEKEDVYESPVYW